MKMVLVNLPVEYLNRFLGLDLFTQIDRKITGKDQNAVKLGEGCYLGGLHFNGIIKGIIKSEWFELPNPKPEYDGDDTMGNYGVCDDYKQILEWFKLQEDERYFVVLLTEMLKVDQPSWGGWRWHKWGTYIGTQEPQCEYLHDEPNIDKVYIYHVYELVEEYAKEMINFEQKGRKRISI